MNREYINCSQLPHTLNSALSRNVSAMECYSRMSESERRNFIDECGKFSNKTEMNDYIMQMTINNSNQI